MNPINPVNNSNKNSSISEPYLALFAQLKKLNFEYTYSFKSITLKQWIILQLIDKLTPACGEDFFKLIIELNKENCDLKQLKSLFASSIRDPELTVHRVLIVQLDLLTSLQKEHINTDLGTIFDDKNLVTAKDENQAIELILKKATTRVQTTFTSLLNTTDQLKKEAEAHFFNFTVLKTPEELNSKNKLLLNRVTTGWDSKWIILCKATFDTLINGLIFLRNNLSTNKSFGTSSTCQRLKNYSLIVNTLFDVRRDALDNFLAKEEKVTSKTDAGSKIEPTLNNINRLINHFKISKEQKDKLIGIIHQTKQNVNFDSYSRELTLVTVMSFLMILESHLKKLDRRASFESIEEVVENFQKALADNHAKKMIGNIQKVHETDIELKKAAQPSDDVVHNKIIKLGQDLKLSGALCVATASLVQNILSKRSKATEETEEDQLAVFSQWEEPINTVEEKQEIDDIEELPAVDEDNEVEAGETSKTKVSKPKANVKPDQQIQHLCELMMSTISATTQVRTKELRGHIYLATRGMNSLLDAFKRQDWKQLGVIYPMLLIDWHSMMESHLTGNKESHSLVARSVGRRLTKTETSLIHSLDNSLIWSRYPESAVYRQEAVKAEGQLWLNYSLELLTGAQPSLIKVNELLQFAARTHCQVLAYVAKASKVKISQEVFDSAQDAITNAWKVDSAGQAKTILTNDNVSRIFQKIDKVLKCPLTTAQKTGVVHSALRDVRSHLLRLVNTAVDARDNVWTDRNLKNLQWVFEQLYVCRYYLRSDQVEHIHDFSLFQNLLGDQKLYSAKILGYNFGTAIHHPYLYEKKDHRARQFCRDLEKEQEGFGWGDEEKGLVAEKLLNLDQGFDLAEKLLDDLIAEGSLGKTFVVIK